MTWRKGWVRRNSSFYPISTHVFLASCCSLDNCLVDNVLCASTGSPSQTSSGFHQHRCVSSSKVFHSSLPFLPRSVAKSHSVRERPYKSPRCAVLHAGPGRLRCLRRCAGELFCLVSGYPLGWGGEGSPDSLSQASAAPPPCSGRIRVSGRGLQLELMAGEGSVPTDPGRCLLSVCSGRTPLPAGSCDKEVVVAPLGQNGRKGNKLRS